MKTPIPALFLTFFSIAPGGTPALHAEPPAATFLRCESLVDPLGLDEPLPRLSWQLASRERGARQTAYRILVASTAELLAKDSGDLWDSGTVESAESIEIPYAGKPLASRQTCFWKVKTRDGRGEESPWSPPAS
jgi:alpha-L-rhamnosidase